MINAVPTHAALIATPGLANHRLAIRQYIQRLTEFTARIGVETDPRFCQAFLRQNQGIPTKPQKYRPLLAEYCGIWSRIISGFDDLCKPKRMSARHLTTAT